MVKGLVAALGLTFFTGCIAPGECNEVGYHIEVRRDVREGVMMKVLNYGPGNLKEVSVDGKRYIVDPKRRYDLVSDE